MLETVQKKMQSYISNFISRIDQTIPAIELMLNRIKAAQAVFDDFGGNGAEGSADHSLDSGLEAVRALLNHLIDEKEYLLKLLEQLNNLSAPGGYPLRSGGKTSICLTTDALSEQAAQLEYAGHMLASDINRSHGVLNNAFDGRMFPEMAEMLDTVAEYRTAAVELIDACRESAGELQQLRDVFSSCEASTAFDFDDVFRRSESSVRQEDAYTVQSSAAPPPMPVQVPYARPSASYGEAARADRPQNTGAEKGKSGFLGLFKRKKQAGTNSDCSGVVPPPCVDSVQFSAVAPNKVVPGKYLPVNIVMYEDAFRRAVDDIVRSHGENAKESRSGYHDVSRNASVRVVLTSPDVTVEDGEEEQIWNGKYLNFEFAVKIPDDFSREQILLSAAVYINEIIATKLKLILDCEKKARRNIRVTREDVVSAFVSYASQDRSRVASIIQGMKKARPDMDIFFDIESLRSGQKWEDALKSEIESRDVLFLCWSRYARESKWVDMEWRYALESKGEDCIEPIPIDSPDICPPPVELQQKHFNDKMLFIIKATMPEVCGQPYLVRTRNQECMILDKPLVRIGKDQKYVDLVISGNAAVSRSHANIIVRDGGYYIIDLNSTNHTYVDGNRIPSNMETLLYHGAKIRFADEEFEFFC